MAGPGVGILLAYELTEEQWNELEQWIHALASDEVAYLPGINGRGGEARMWQFGIANGDLIGLPSAAVRAAGRFNLDVGYDFSPVEQEQYYANPIHQAELRDLADLDEIRAQNQQALAALGFLPAQTLSLSAVGNDPIDHRVLGHLALLLARRYHGLIDLYGRLLPPRSFQPGQAWVWYEATDEERTQYEQDLALPGRLWHVFDSTIVDSDWLQGWLQHPHFRLIK